MDGIVGSIQRFLVMIRERGKVRQDTVTSNTSGIKMLNQQILPTNIAKVFVSQKDVQVYEGRVELDTHADTFVAGRNCILMNYTKKECNVMAYSGDYEPKKVVPIVQVATGYTNASGERFILIINEAIWLPSMECSLSLAT